MQIARAVALSLVAANVNSTVVPTLSPTSTEGPVTPRGCTDSNCFGDCLHPGGDEWREKNSHDLAFCLSYCYSDPCNSNGWDQPLPDCSNATREANRTGCSYTCAGPGACDLPPGYGPDGRWEAEVTSSEPVLEVAVETMDKGGMTWAVTLDLNSSDYTADVEFKLSTKLLRNEIYYDKMNFGFTCKNEPYKLLPSEDGKWVRIQFTTGYQLYSDCLRKKLEEYAIQLHSVLQVITTADDKTVIALAFDRQIPRSVPLGGSYENLQKVFMRLASDPVPGPVGWHRPPHHIPLVPWWSWLIIVPVLAIAIYFFCNRSRKHKNTLKRYRDAPTVFFDDRAFFAPDPVRAVD